jgi:hypothetical protein
MSAMARCAGSGICEGTEHTAGAPKAGGSSCGPEMVNCAPAGLAAGGSGRRSMAAAISSMTRIQIKRENFLICFCAIRQRITKTKGNRCLGWPEIRGFDNPRTTAAGLVGTRSGSVFPQPAANRRRQHRGGKRRTKRPRQCQPIYPSGRTRNQRGLRRRRLELRRRRLEWIRFEQVAAFVPEVL